MKTKKELLENIKLLQYENEKLKKVLDIVAFCPHCSGQILVEVGVCTSCIIDYDREELDHLNSELHQLITEIYFK